jgi:nicotinamidase/pyrazinamidase
MPELSIEADDALVVVDVQHDFLPGGALAVAEGERIFAPINALLPRFPRVYATRDWHPPDHSSFTQHGGPWPVHCVAGSHGAALDQRLCLSQTARIVEKGVDRKTDGYSGFAATDLAADLRAHGVRRIFVCGLATDYCVKATALDAKAEEFGVVVLADASAAVNLRPTDEDSALEELRRAGVRIANSTELLGQIAMLAAAGAHLEPNEAFDRAVEI